MNKKVNWIDEGRADQLLEALESIAYFKEDYFYDEEKDAECSLAAKEAFALVCNFFQIKTIRAN